MGCLRVPRMLAANSLVVSATSFRLGVSWTGLAFARTPELVRQAALASLGGKTGDYAAARFREGLVGWGRDWSEVVWRELRRGVDDLDTLTRPGERPAARPSRPYRVKT